MAERPARIVVLDTNVVLSALLFQRGPLARLRLLWHAGDILPLVSAATTKELLRVLMYPKFGLSVADREELLADYLPYTKAVKPEGHPNDLAHLPMCRDPHDQMFLELAQAGNAEILLTGDRDLLALNDPLHKHMRFLVLAPAEGLKRLED